LLHIFEHGKLGFVFHVVGPGFDGLQHEGKLLVDVALEQLDYFDNELLLLAGQYFACAK